MILIIFLIVPILLLLPMALLKRVLCCSRQGQVLAVIMAGLFSLGLWLLPQVQAKGVLEYNLAWVPQAGLSFSLYVDGLSMLFILLVTGMGAVIMLYAGYYFEDPAQSARFFNLILLFISSMLALVTAGNLVTLFIAWELTSVISFLLIGFKGSDSKARSGALQALMITGAGGLALFAGLLLAGTAAGSMELSQILASGDLLRSHPWYPAVAILIMVGAFTKSAQFPVHFWLPGAMSAPTPASAFLHSATMVKAGIYLLLRMAPILGDTPLWENGLMWVGGLTTAIAALLALWQFDLKGILAYTTVSQLGALVLLIGLPGGGGIKAAAIGILAHALYKGTLFLVAGSIDHYTGTRNIRELGGLGRWIPGYAVITGLVVLSMAGVPPFFGFVAKETLIEALIHQPIFLGLSLVSAVLTIAIAFRLFWDVFMRPPRISLPQQEHEEHDFHHPLGDDAYDYSHAHDLPPGMLIGPALTAAFSLIFGIGISPLLVPLISAVMGKSTKLYLFPPGGLNLAFGLGMGAIVLGTLLFLARRKYVRWDPPVRVTGEKVYQMVIRAIEAAGDFLLLSQNGKIRYYLSAIMLTVVVILSISMFNLQFRLPEPLFQFQGAYDLLKIVLLLIALGATLASILLEQHLAAVLALGVAGYAIGGLFLLEPAPDVALVQFLVETLATVLLVLILARTSTKGRQEAMRRLWQQSRQGLGRDLFIAVTTGAAVTVFALAAVSGPPVSQRVPAWYLQNALPEVGVKDIVAGIITDFRGTDTLVEITVFSLASLGVLTMLTRPKPGKVLSWKTRKQKIAEKEAITEKEAILEDSERPEELVYKSQLRDSITQLAAYILLPLSFLIAIAHILYAGAAPGDGFTAGVIAGLGVTLWYVVFGYEQTNKRLSWLHPGPIIGLGLVIAFTNALLPLLFGRPFLIFTPLADFSIAGIKLASPLFFEIGICLAVFGGMSGIIQAISHPKEAESL